MSGKSRRLFVVKPDPKDRVGPETPPSERVVSTPADPPLRYLGLPPLERVPAGTAAPVSGVYRAYHHQHRLPHSLFVAKDQLMPACRRCGDRVQYGLLLSAGTLDEDADLDVPIRKIG